MEARVVDAPTKPLEGGVNKVLGHRETCKLPIADVVVVIGPHTATLVIEHLTFSRGKRSPKLCYVDIA